MKKQVFMNKFTSSVSKNIVLKMFNDGELTNTELLICEFLFTNKFATLGQINEFLSHKGYSRISSNSAFTLSQNRIVNRFILTEDESNKDLDDNNKLIYCLDIGGKYLLTHYSSLDTSEWLTSNNMMSSELVESILMSNEIYLKLLNNVKDKLVSFNILEERRVGRQSTTIDFDFGIKSGDSTKYYIGNFIRETDMPRNFQNKAEKIESLISTNAWKKYYYGSESAPACFFIGETDLFTLNVATQINECYIYSGKDRYSSFDRVLKKKLHDKDTFLKYDDNGVEKSFKASKIASFVPDEN